MLVAVIERRGASALELSKGCVFGLMVWRAHRCRLGRDAYLARERLVGGAGPGIPWYEVAEAGNVGQSIRRAGG